MKKIEFSKLIFLWLAIIATAAVVYTMAAVWHTGDVSPLDTMTERVFAAVMVCVGFYYWKARAENKIKLRKKYGENIYNDAMKGENDDEEYYE